MHVEYKNEVGKWTLNSVNSLKQLNKKADKAVKSTCVVHICIECKLAVTVRARIQAQRRKKAFMFSWQQLKTDSEGRDNGGATLETVAVGLWFSLSD